MFEIVKPIWKNTNVLNHNKLKTKSVFNYLYNYSFVRNRSHLAMAQAAPLIDSSEGYGGQDVCGRCGKRVYFAEQAMGGGNVSTCREQGGGNVSTCQLSIYKLRNNGDLLAAESNNCTSLYINCLTFV